MTTLHKPFCLFEYDVRNFHMSLSRLIKSRGNHFSPDTTCHVCNLFGAFINQKHNHIHLRMVVCNCICNILQKDSLSGFGLSYNKPPLTFTYWRKHIHNPCRKTVMAIGCDIELLVWEQWSQKIKRNPVPNELGTPSIDLFYLYQRKVFIPLFWRLNLSGK
ncbi:hypothetical protein SDC9_206157 [bioreactor metagenome]|uniref:Uncharacterized protein n=1 Tax=bioreactor metagenome TaxID=1076179 RepID=A0A645J5P4_9ZZZZ